MKSRLVMRKLITMPILSCLYIAVLLYLYANVFVIHCIH